MNRKIATPYVTGLTAVAATTLSSATEAQTAFDGANVGLMFSDASSSDLGVDYEYGDTYTVGGSALGGFAGYNMSFGNVVVGGEIGVHVGDYTVADTPYGVGHLIDAKIRVGIAMDDVLIYGVLGSSRGDIVSTEGSDYDYESMSGTSVGIGIEYQVNDNFFLGAELLQRKMDLPSDFESVKISQAGSKLNTISIRGGFRF